MGLDYLHYNGIMHCDLSANKSSCYLLVRPGKISDFGQSVLVSAETGYVVINSHLGPCSTCPPEALKEDRPEFGSQIDMFSLGVLMIQAMRPSPSE